MYAHIRKHQYAGTHIYANKHTHATHLVGTIVEIKVKLFLSLVSILN